jgi:hypothetical protein
MTVCGLGLCIAAIPARASDEDVSEGNPTTFDFQQAAVLLTDSCADCHADGAEEGEFALESLLDDSASLADRFERWRKVAQRINDRSMPPADSEPMPADKIMPLVQWIESATISAVCADGTTAGPPMLRRLAKHEYSNTIRDLLDVHFDAGQGLPEDTAGGEGFNNAAETLIISPIHAEKYLQAAVDALDYAARNDGTRRRLLRAQPSAEKSESEAARENLQWIATRAFRRPAEKEEVDRLVALFESARADNLPFDESVLYAMRAVLISPGFLFIAESTPAEVGVATPVTDHELATRLSYFLWASMPDRELMESADAGRLSDPDELRKQTLRMLGEKGTHLQDSMEQFVGSWLGTSDVGHSKRIDNERHPRIDDPDVAALRNQPVYAMVSILQENDSLLDLIDADWTFLNDELVRVYKLQKSKIEDDFVQNLKRVRLPEEYRNRGGVLGMGGVYVVSSYPQRSSPVLRGAWVLEKMLGIELPPPPPDVPALDDSVEGAEPQTVRQRLEKHRQDAACATCHDRIDPIGFAMENFDEIGRWRDRDDGGEIDSVAELPGGTRIEGIGGLKKHLLDQKEAVVRNLVQKMLGYALGRSLQPTDLCTVEDIVQQLKQSDYRSQELILGIVTSDPFRMKLITEGQPQ